MHSLDARRPQCILLLLALGLHDMVPTGRAQELRAGAAAENFEADDAQVISGGIGPGKVRGQEGQLRASAVVLEGPAGVGYTPHARASDLVGH